MSSDYPQITVGETLGARQEFYELAHDLTPTEQLELRADAIEDPHFGDSLRAEDSLRGLASALQNLVAAKTSEHPDADATVTQDTAHNTAWDTLADLEEDARQAELAEKNKATIAKTHAYLTEYQEASRGLGRKPTVKQRRSAELALKRGFRERWTAAELADEPEQLRTMFESIVAAEDVSPNTKRVVQEYVGETIYEHVKETATKTEPDTVGRRIKAALEPSLAQERLTDVLLGAHFKAAEGRQTDEIMDNYELFVRGILRCADSPLAMQQAVDIAHFKTDLLPSGSLYSFHLQTVPNIRMDRPELYGRGMGLAKTISQIQLYLGDLSTLSMQDRGNNFTDMAASLEEAESQFSEHEAMQIVRDTRYGELIVMQTHTAVAALGENTYKLRINAMEACTAALSGEEGMRNGLGLFVDDTLATGMSSVHSADTAINVAVSQYPEAREFLEVMFGTPSLPQDELPHYIKDPTNDLLNLVRSEEGKMLLDTAMRMMDPEEFVGMTADEISAEIEEELGGMRTIPIPLGDGFVVDWNIPGGGDYPTEEEVASLLETLGEERLAVAKEQLTSSGNIRRRHEIIDDREAGVQVVIRYENEEDRKEFHPIDQLTGYSEGGEDLDVELRLLIEQSRTTIQKERRRFLNDRGIEYQFEDEGDEKLALRIHKHPRNPQAFIVTLLNTDEQGEQSAQILMDDSLVFQLGSKKVRSSSNLLVLNAVAAGVLEYFMCQEAVETTEGVISEGNNLVARIAHLRLLPEGQQSSYAQWEKCLEAEGLDLDVLSKQQAEKFNTTRATTYVQAVEDDNPDKGPIQVLVKDEDIFKTDLI